MDSVDIRLGAVPLLRRLSRDVSLGAKLSVMRFVRFWLILGPCGVQHVLTWVYLSTAWSCFEASAPFAVLLVIDAALLSEHVYLFYVTLRWSARCVESRANLNVRL
mmetsp:Transcript_27378/g.45653  ORF Transcript_27378/g.45653 Transcript_27378/m.45653 type:complete len:106 (+) Transcript_27378:364-681(+)